MPRILVVDDEELLLGLLKNYLTRLGHDVASFPNGHQALEAIETQAPFTLAVLDHWLPDIDGHELLERVLKSSDDIRVLVASGSLLDRQSLAAVDSSRVAFLQKPYLPKSLAAAVEELLNRPPSS